MEMDEALEMLRHGIPSAGGVWADLGAGSGLFTRALARLIGRAGKVVAVDRDSRCVRKLSALEGETSDHLADVRAVQGDFTRIDEVAELNDILLDGAVFANALHYVSDPAAVLSATVPKLTDAGRIIVIEYDRTTSNPWVPFPIPMARLERIAEQMRMVPPKILKVRPSAFGTEMYSAILERRIAKKRARG